ncbi:Cellulase (glycosyl hydrolase family 5 protein) [Ceratobasidium sp. AG-Ba]|nr:Cellulase (glycosyl hydrolase family 5 protein) [Ceratobasidium sp. AG-Ba]
MRLHHTTYTVGLLAAALVCTAKNALPVDKVYGVNLGSWLLTEPWMLPTEWKAMGGEICNNCSTCIMSEFALTQKLGQKQADEVFAQHWSTWLTRDDVDAIADAGLNTVRIPLGYWIIEPLVDRSTEFYPRGGLPYLKQALRMFKAKGIHVILDFHALPGVASANQMFAGRCTYDVQFYTEKNYIRALAWAGVMTALSHLDPDFASVFSIEAINEPEMDYKKTPSLGEYEKNFVKIVRLTELALGVSCPDTDYTKLFSNTASFSPNHLTGGIAQVAELADGIVGQVLSDFVLPAVEFAAKQLGLSTEHVKRAVGRLPESEAHTKDHDAPTCSGSGCLGAKLSQPLSDTANVAGEKLVPHGYSLERHVSGRRAHRKRGISAKLGPGCNNQCLSTNFMNKDWQYNNPANPADAAIGPQTYDAHLYFSFGGVADPNYESYMRVICNTDRVAKATAEGNTPMCFGEWSLASNFNITNEQMRDWADAQKWVYAGQAAGWIFWNFKVEKDTPYTPAWDYFASLDAGYLTKDPSKLYNPDICKPWIANATYVS